MKWVRCLCLVSAAMALSVTARAQDYPSKPIRVIVATAAGGIMDVASLLHQGNIQWTSLFLHCKL